MTLVTIPSTVVGIKLSTVSKRRTGQEFSETNLTGSSLRNTSDKQHQALGVGADLIACLIQLNQIRIPNGFLD